MEAEARYAIDWDNDLFICYEALETDALNVMHDGLSDDFPGLVNLHWGYVNTSIENGATAAFQQEFTAYGIRLFHVVTGTNTSAGAYFGRTGSTNDFNLSNGAVYTAVLWIRATVGVGSTLNFAMENSSGVQSITLTAAWQKVSLTFTAGAITNSFRLYKLSNATDLTFDATGFMIVEGSNAPNGFNVGNASNLYDVLTEVRSSNWRFGKEDWKNTMPSEGTAELVVSNTDRRYSPEYTGSPLYGSMEQKRLMTIDVWHPGNAAWQRRFAGWTSNYQPQYGKVADYYTVISAEQGIFRLREIKFRRAVSEAVTADALIRDVLMDGYVTPLTPLQCLVGNSRLNAGYTVDPDVMMELETGISSIPLSGEAWSSKESAANVIESVMSIERGWFFIDGEGLIRFFNRYHYIDPALAPTAKVFDLDSDVVSGGYVHGKEFKNTVRLTYYPTTTETLPIWTNREVIGMLPGQTKEIEVRFEYEEGRQMEVLSVNAFGDGVDDSSVAAATASGADQSWRVRPSFQQLDGRGGMLTLVNLRGASRRVTVTLRGLVKQSYGGQVIQVDSDLPNQSGTYVMDFSSKLIDNEQDANNLAQFLLSMHERAVGEFKNISLIGMDDTGLRRILDTAIGDEITLSEYQTGHSGRYAVIGESHSVEQDGVLRSQFMLEPLFRRHDHWILGTSALGVDTYLGY